MPVTNLVKPLFAAPMRALHRPVYRRRLRVLVDLILPHLKPGDQILDVGCGEGTLARALLDDPRRPPDVAARGLERAPRGGEPIEVIGYNGGDIPLESGSADLVILADVLHHEPDPDHLAAECARVARRALVIKDHQIKGVLAHPRISLIDWAANAPYGVPCLYRYNTPDGWRNFRERLGLTAVQELSGVSLYPPVVDQCFGGSLQYFAVLGKRVDP